MSSTPAQSIAPRASCQPLLIGTVSACGFLQGALDALLTRRATWLWWTGSGFILLVGLLLHGSAWLGIPTIATADTNAYCELLHTIESGVLPDLRDRNIGYPLFMFLCKLLPIPLNRGLPLTQHLLEITAGIVLMTWMRRNWGVLAGLVTGGLLLPNAARVIWVHYAHPNALLCSVVPVAVLLLMGWIATGRRWQLAVTAVLWFVVLLTRDEVLLLAVVPPAVLVLFHPAARRRCLVWGMVLGAIVLVGGGGRLWINARATGQMVYSTHSTNIIAWRGLHTASLVAPPRPKSLERLYQAALENGARWRGSVLHYEDLWRAGRDKWGMTQREAIDYMAGCAVECIRRRPAAFVVSTFRDAGKLWLHPKPGLEWEAFRKSDPKTFSRDAARLPWATHSRAEFPIDYPSSKPQRLFRAMAIVRPGEFFAVKPLVAGFLSGSLCLLLGLGTGGFGFRRWWFAALSVSVVSMTLFYAAVVDVPNRYRLSVEWAFFAVAALGLVLPLREVRRRIAPARAAQRARSGLDQVRDRGPRG